MKGNYVSSHELKGKPRRNIQIACTFQMRWPKEVQKVPEHWRSVWKHSSTCFCMEFHWTNADWKIDISFNLSDMPTSKISLDTDKSFYILMLYSCYSHATSSSWFVAHNIRKMHAAPAPKAYPMTSLKGWFNQVNRIKLNRAMKPPETTFIFIYIYIRYQGRAW